MKRITFEEADETLFIPDRSAQSATAGLQPWAVRHNRRVRVQSDRRAGVESVYVWFEPKP